MSGVYQGMRWEEIEAALAPEHGPDLEGWRETYQREVEGPVTDLHAFVRWLRDTARISNDLFRSLHMQRRADVSSQAETLAEITLLPEDLDRLEGAVVDAVPLEGDELPLVEEGPPLKVVGRLAAGAMGEILICRERDLRRQVALKRMHAGLAEKPRLARRFLHEAQITAQLDHPNIVPVYNLLAERGQLPSYTMKLVRGKTFAQLIGEARDVVDTGREPDDEHALDTLLEHFVRACDAIAYAHSRGVVHRDLKPENIMVGAYGEVYVMDWGIARVMGSREGSDDAVQLGSTDLHRTRLGAVLGTPAYMSPEQALGRNDQLDGRSDVFSLGLILAELVTLRPAASGKDTLQLVGRMQAARIEPLRHHDAGRRLDPGLVAIVGRCTQERPQDRYATATALAEDVRHLLRGEPIHALPETRMQRAARWVGAHRVLALSVIIGLLTVLAGVTITSLGSTLYTVRQASWREAHLSRLQSDVATRGRELDARFQALPGHLEALATVTLQALSRRETPAGADSQYYLDIEAAPDLAPSAAYHRPISLNHPNTVLPIEVSLDDQREALQRLATLGPAFRRVLVAAHPRDLGALSRSERTLALRDETTPVRWVYLALESGVGLSYPGHPGVPPGLDLRDEPWYAAAVAKRG
ncbi:MAG: serine/threonine protein kinase, partial [Myxococcales bacterium]|nr:serine/threonine protein kinase [Myxococcales bacterium]